MSTVDEMTVSGGTSTLIEERTDYRTDDGDHERFSHYAPKDKITEAMVFGTPVTALCGKTWVPSRDPKRYPICPTCKEIYDGPGWAEDGGGDKAGKSGGESGSGES
ncbi:MAG TPA: DUF3039 domain-containing protein [Actinospica sp.]|jgi:hypothetical protein|nr:DUF3039 domain-containing protein [Actinospica sp.]